MSVAIFESDNGTKERTKKEIEDIADGLSAEVRAELEEIWEKIWMEAIELCPKRTGALASSIKVIEGGLGLGEIGHIKEEMIFDRSIMAGDVTVINPESGKPTSDYASLVHDGHRMRDGTFWEGVPFLTEAIMMYEDELNKAIDRALKELEKGA